MCQCVIHCLWVHVSVCHTLPLSACVSVSYIAFECMCQCVIHRLRSHVPLCHTLHLSACVSVSYIALDHMCQCVIYCLWAHVLVCDAFSSLLGVLGVYFVMLSWPALDLRTLRLLTLGIRYKCSHNAFPTYSHNHKWRTPLKPLTAF